MSGPAPAYDRDGITLFHGDCLAVLPTLAAGSVDAIVTDPPYFRTARESWDNQWPTAEAYLGWLGRVADEWRRALKPAGSLYVFASPRMAARIECLVADRFNVINAITWQKDSPCGALKYGAENFRGFVEMSERIIFAESREQDIGDTPARRVFGEYLESEMRRASVSRKHIAQLFPSRTGGLTGCATNWIGGLNVPTATQYEAIRDMLNATGGSFMDSNYDDLRREHEELQKKYLASRRPFFARVDAPHTDTWTFKPVAQARLRHPCEKPLPLLTHILQCSTRPDDLILDGFAGSGSTLVAAAKAGRRAIGIEIDGSYVPDTIKRLHAAETPLFNLGATL